MGGVRDALDGTYELSYNATVAGLWDLQDKPIPSHWNDPWVGQVGVSLAGQANLELSDIVARTLALLDTMSSA